MTINDGFGDDVALEEYAAEQELLAKHYNTAQSLAHQMRIPTDSADFDDLVQEGAVAAWQATQVERADPVVYGMVVARRRIQGHLRGKHPMLGSEREGGRIHDQHRQTDKRDVVEDIAEKAWERDIFREIERRVDVDRATRDMKDRDRALIREVALHGLNWTEIAASLGMTPNAAQKYWRAKVRPALQERLRTVA